MTANPILPDNKDSIYKKAFKLILEKDVDIREFRKLLFLKGSYALESYNHYAIPRGRLTEEEFNLLVWVCNYDSH